MRGFWGLGLLFLLIVFEFSGCVHNRGSKNKNSQEYGSLKRSDSEQERLNFARDYINFLAGGKTVREFIGFTVGILKNHGFTELKNSGELSEGDRVYMTFRNKAILAARVGADPFEHGLMIVVVTIDSPRLDVKQVPLIQSNGLCLLNTRFYGDMELKQWLSVPLALHGAFVDKSGKLIQITVGENLSDPVFVIPDLLPHLSTLPQRMGKIAPEQMDVLVGGGQIVSKKTSPLEQLTKEFGVDDDSFLSGEFSFVPAGAPKFIGADKGFISFYSQQFRSIFFAALAALTEAEPKYTLVLIGIEKSQSRTIKDTGLFFVRYGLSTLIKHLSTESPLSSKAVQIVLYRSRGLTSFSVDGSMNGGPAFNRLSDNADLEAYYFLLNLLDRNQVSYQITKNSVWGSLGKKLSDLGIKTIDMDLPVFGVGTPFELISTFDLYETFRAVLAFYNSPVQENMVD